LVFSVLWALVFLASFFGSAGLAGVAGVAGAAGVALAGSAAFGAGACANAVETNARATAVARIFLI